MARRSDQRGDAGRTLRVLALTAVAIGLAALVAGACALSYASIHALAITSGVSVRLARIYPLIFDAMLVIAGCSVLALRGAGLVSRIYGWLCLLVLLAGLAAGGVIHAARFQVAHRPAEIAAAIIPWVLVLVGLGLLLALLRYARLRRGDQRPGGARHADSPGQEEEPALTGGIAVPPPTPADSGIAAALPPPADRGLAMAFRPPAELEAGHAAPVVTQADLQLRARVPRQPPELELEPRLAQETAPAPLMPPVGPSGLTGKSPRTNPRLTTGAPARDEPPAGVEPGQENTAGTDARTTEAGTTEAGTTEAGDSGADGMQASADHAESGLNAAPTLGPAGDAASAALPAVPPALDRPRSSPTPPEG